MGSNFLDNRHPSTFSPILLIIPSSATPATTRHQSKDGMEAAKRLKSEVDSYKKRLVEKVEEAKKLLLEKVPKELQPFLRKTSQMLRILESRVNSFTESHSRYQAVADTDVTKETDKLFQLDVEGNRALLEESKELITSVQELLDSVREEERKALVKSVADEQLALTRRFEEDKLKQNIKFEEDRLKQSREFEEKRLTLEKERLE